MDAGYVGSVVNHDDDPNCKFEDFSAIHFRDVFAEPSEGTPKEDELRGVTLVVAIKDVDVMQEFTVSYGRNYDWTGVAR